MVSHEEHCQNGRHCRIPMSDDLIIFGSDSYNFTVSVDVPSTQYDLIERLEHTCVSHQDSYLDSVDLKFSYLWTAFYVTVGTSILHEREVKTSRFREM